MLHRKVLLHEEGGPSLPEVLQGEHLSIQFLRLHDIQQPCCFTLHVHVVPGSIREKCGYASDLDRSTMATWTTERVGVSADGRES